MKVSTKVSFECARIARAPNNRRRCDPLNSTLNLVCFAIHYACIPFGNASDDDAFLISFFLSFQLTPACNPLHANRCKSKDKKNTGLGEEKEEEEENERSADETMTMLIER